jgi:hypothetical protein
MALDREFLGRLDREIASLRGRIDEQIRHQAQPNPDKQTSLREMEAGLTQLQDIRQRIVEQSHGD